MDRENLPIADLLAELDARLDRLGPEGVRAAVIAHARSLRPSARRGFLEVFDTATPDSSSLLLAQVNDLVARIEGAEPRWIRRRWFEDPEPTHPELTDAVEDLLVALGERFVAGELEVAAAGLRPLLSAVAATVDSDDVVLLPAPDLTCEARDRLVLAIGHDDQLTTAERAHEIVAAIDDCAVLAPVPTLPDLAEPRHGSAPLDDEVLRVIAERIDADLAQKPGWGRTRWLDLLLSVREHLDGRDEVLAVARGPDGVAVDVYRWLADRHLDDGDFAGAAAVLDEALDRCSDSYPLAELADLAAGIYHRMGSAHGAARPAERAWGAHPTTRRLEVLLEVEPPEEVARTLERLPAADGLIAAQAAAVVGDVDAVMAAGESDRALRVPDPSAFAAAWLCATTQPGRTALVEGWLHRTCVERTDHLAELMTRHRRRHDIEIPVTPLAIRLLDAEPTGDPEERLSGALTIVEQTAERVTTTKQRQAYGTAAGLVVMVGDCLERAGMQSREQVVATFDHRYRRFAAFRRELRDADAVADAPARIRPRD